MITVNINDNQENLQHYRVKIEGYNEKSYRYLVESFKFESDDGFTKLTKMQMQKGKIPILRCKCGSWSFTENGRYIGEYECPCCSEFIEIHFVQGES